MDRGGGAVPVRIVIEPAAAAVVEDVLVRVRGGGSEREGGSGQRTVGERGEDGIVQVYSIPPVREIGDRVDVGRGRQRSVEVEAVEAAAAGQNVVAVAAVPVTRTAGPPVRLP
jgi:hypothetical protein